MISYIARAIAIMVLVFSMALVCQAQGRRERNTLSAEERRVLIQQAKDRLNNTTWEIELTQMDTGRRKRKMRDTVRFINNRVEFEKMLSLDFSPTNFTVRMKGEDVIIWETMQTSEKKGLAFWRGEIRGENMRGVLSWHLNERTMQDYTFVSAGKR